MNEKRNQATKTKGFRTLLFIPNVHLASLSFNSWFKMVISIMTDNEKKMQNNYFITGVRLNTCSYPACEIDVKRSLFWSGKRRWGWQVR